MSLIKLRHFDSYKLFACATEPGFRASMEDNFLAINPDNVCSVTVGRYSKHSTDHYDSGNNLSFVFLPVIIRMIDGSIYEVLEDFESVVGTLSGEAGSLYINRGFTIDCSENQYNSELVPCNIGTDYTEIKQKAITARNKKIANLYAKVSGLL